MMDLVVTVRIKHFEKGPYLTRYTLVKMDHQVSSENTWTFSLDYVYMQATEL